MAEEQNRYKNQEEKKKEKRQITIFKKSIHLLSNYLKVYKNEQTSTAFKFSEMD